MSGHKYSDLHRALGRGELQPAYYLFGVEDILKEEASRAILKLALEPHERDFNFDQRGAAGLSPEDLHALVNTLPMMANRRVVFIRDIEVWKKKAAAREVLLKYLANPSNDTVLVLMDNAPATDEKRREYEPDAALAAHSYAVDFEELTPERATRWLEHRAKDLGVHLGEGAAEHLAAAVGYSLGALRSELEKLTSLAEQGPISREQVGELVGVRHGETLENWVAAVLADDTPRAISLCGGVLAQGGMSGVKMVTTLGSALIGLRLARLLYEKGSRGSALERSLMSLLQNRRLYGIGDWKFLARIWSQTAEQWPSARLRAATRATLETDQALKGTRVTDELGVLTDLVLRLRGSAAEGIGGAARQHIGATS
ncbi:MAG: DNA polymerase III subunit delta [Gemmatimonadota bacterium]